MTKNSTLVELIDHAVREHDAVLLKFVNDKWSVTLRMNYGDWWYWSAETLKQAILGALFNPTAEQQNYEWDTL